MTGALGTHTETASRLAERQMRRWVIDLEIKDRLTREHQKAVKRLPQQIHPYLAISRDFGAGAAEVAQLVGQKLGWQVLDRAVLNLMAEKYQLDKIMLEAVDEKATSWLLEVFGKWINQRVVTQNEYMVRLGRILLIAAGHDSTVFVGRGAHLLLPRERGLAVQILAPREQRLQRIMQREQISRKQALTRLDSRDRERREFVAQNFHKDVTDPHLYDLVVNLEYFDID
jgi:cytidylate kinase